MSQSNQRRFDSVHIAGALGVDKRSVNRRASRELWPYEEVLGNGGSKRLYNIEVLPTDVRQALQAYEEARIVEDFKRSLPDSARQALYDAPAPQRNLAPQPAHEETEQVRAVRDARHAVRTAVFRLQDQAGCSLKRAVITLLTQAQAGQMDKDVLSAMFSLARDGRGRKSQRHSGLPSERTLFRWLASDDLLPKRRKQDMSIKPWMAAAVEIHARPQKPTIKQTHDLLCRNWNPEWGTPVSYDTIKRFFRQKFSRIDLLTGQNSGSALRAHKRY